ncbi:MAG: hypothetical protein R6V36_00585 [Psychroflexus sp.]
MKYISLLVLVVFTACKSSQTELPLLQNCPGNGDCEVQVFKETKLLLTEESSEVSDVSFEEDKDFQVIYIRYKDSKKVDYTEEVYLQIPSRFKEIHSKNHSLQNQKVVFGKFCDCNEQGFVRINHGELLIVNNKEFISLHLEIKSEKNQVIQVIDLDI